jgi:hypothetical protein
MKTDLLATASPPSGLLGTLARPAGAERRTLVRAFWAAAALSLVLAWVPYGRLVLYPFALLSTWAHEMGHGLTALLAGGAFDHLVLYPDLGGTAFNRVPQGLFAPALVAAGGLVGPAVAGGLTIVFGARPRLSRVVLYVFAGLLLASLAVWVRNPFGMAAVLGLAVGFGALARYAGDGIKLTVAQLTGIQLCLGSVSDFDYMFTRDFLRDGQVQISDTQAIAQQLFLPYWFWGGLVALASLLILGTAFWFAWVRPALRARAIQ